MDHYLPKFKSFLFQDLLYYEADYIVPIKSKGALILEELVKRYKIDLRDKLVYERFFDFISPDFLTDKKIWLIDDVVFTGKTLHELSNSLKEKGIERIYKLAFLKRKVSGKRDFQELLGDVRAFGEISSEEYGSFVKEITKLYLNKRPSYPDHISFIVTFEKPLTTNVLSELGCLIEYDRNPAIREFSLHYPFFKRIEKNKFKEYNGPFKIRLRNYVPDPLKWIISPVIFCSLTYQPQLNELDNELDIVEKEILKILSRDWHSEETKKIDLYESITLADRLIYTKIFIQYLSEMGIKAKKIELELENLEKYYGSQVCINLKEIINKVFYDDILTNISCIFEKSTEDIEIYKIPNLIIPILTLLYEKYLEYNKGKTISERKSFGLTIKEIAKEINENIYTISAACELVNDYGYLIPLVKLFSRTYRNSEMGEYIINQFNKL